MKRCIVRICEGVERKAWYSDSGLYRILECSGLGYATPYKYVIQYRYVGECGFSWFICRVRDLMLADPSEDYTKFFKGFLVGSTSLQGARALLSLVEEVHYYD